MRWDGIEILQAKSINFNKVASKSGALVKNETAFVDMMKPFMNNIRVISLQCRVYFVDSTIKDIIVKLMFSEFLLMWNRETHPCYVLFAKFLLNNEQSLPLLLKLSEEAGMQKHLGVSHLKRHVLYGSMDKDVMLMDESAHFTIKNRPTTPQRYVISFEKEAKPMLKDPI